MKIQKVVVGMLDTNCYVLDIDGKVLVIDPGDEYGKINDVINSREVIGVLITHRHFDHIGALSYFDGIDIYGFNNLKEKKYNIGPFEFEVIFSPGHSSDSVSYYFKNVNSLFSGDFIFYHDIGRCDLPTGSFKEMMKSIENIKKIPSDTLICPGHGRETTLKEEIANNYYFTSR